MNDQPSSSSSQPPFPPPSPHSPDKSKSPKSNFTSSSDTTPVAAVTPASESTKFVLGVNKDVNQGTLDNNIDNNDNANKTVSIFIFPSPGSSEGMIENEQEDKSKTESKLPTPESVPKMKETIINILPSPEPGPSGYLPAKTHFEQERGGLPQTKSTTAAGSVATSKDTLSNEMLQTPNPHDPDSSLNDPDSSSNKNSTDDDKTPMNLNLSAFNIEDTPQTDPKSDSDLGKKPLPADQDNVEEEHKDKKHRDVSPLHGRQIDLTEGSVQETSAKLNSSAREKENDNDSCTMMSATSKNASASASSSNYFRGARNRGNSIQESLNEKALKQQMLQDDIDLNQKIKKKSSETGLAFAEKEKDDNIMVKKTAKISKKKDKKHKDKKKNVVGVADADEQAAHAVGEDEGDDEDNSKERENKNKEQIGWCSYICMWIWNALTCKNCCSKRSIDSCCFSFRNAIADPSITVTHFYSYFKLSPQRRKILKTSCKYLFFFFLALFILLYIALLGSLTYHLIVIRGGLAAVPLIGPYLTSRTIGGATSKNTVVTVSAESRSDSTQDVDIKPNEDSSNSVNGGKNKDYGNSVNHATREHTNDKGTTDGERQKEKDSDFNLSSQEIQTPKTGQSTNQDLANEGSQKSHDTNSNSNDNTQSSSYDRNNYQPKQDQKKNQNTYVAPKPEPDSDPHIPWRGLAFETQCWASCSNFYFRESLCPGITAAELWNAANLINSQNAASNSESDSESHPVQKAPDSGNELQSLIDSSILCKVTQQYIPQVTDPPKFDENHVRNSDHSDSKESINISSTQQTQDEDNNLEHNDEFDSESEIAQDTQPVSALQQRQIEQASRSTHTESPILSQKVKEMLVHNFSSQKFVINLEFYSQEPWIEGNKQKLKEYIAKNIRFFGYEFKQQDVQNLKKEIKEHRSTWIQLSQFPVVGDHMKLGGFSQCSLCHSSQTQSQPQMPHPFNFMNPQSLLKNKFGDLYNSLKQMKIIKQNAAARSRTKQWQLIGSIPFIEQRAPGVWQFSTIKTSAANQNIFEIIEDPVQNDTPQSHQLRLQLVIDFSYWVSEEPADPTKEMFHIDPLLNEFLQDLNHAEFFDLEIILEVYDSLKKHGYWSQKENHSEPDVFAGIYVRDLFMYAVGHDKSEGGFYFDWTCFNVQAHKLQTHKESFQRVQSGELEGILYHPISFNGVQKIQQEAWRIIGLHENA